VTVVLSSLRRTSFPLSTFSVGDLAQLKSGGPAMVVARVLKDAPKGFEKFPYAGEGLRAGDVVCSWFDGATKQTGTFRHETLVPAPEAE